MASPGEGRDVAGRLGTAPADTDEAARAAAVDEYRAFLRSAEQVLDGVDRVLASLDVGSYGTCEACGAPIEDGLLEEDPAATRCAAHRVMAASPGI